MTEKDFINWQLSLPTPGVRSTVPTSGTENTFAGENSFFNKINQPKGENNGKSE